MSYQPINEKSVLVIFGYKTGAKGGLPSERRSCIWRCFRADLRGTLTVEEFSSAHADYWGEPLSAERLVAICKCIAQPMQGYFGKRQYADAAIQRALDLDFCRSELLTPEIQTLPELRRWSFPSAANGDVDWARNS